ncbi:MAG: PspA/IM30 family protein [Janthinobacterium lividum]
MLKTIATLLRGQAAEAEEDLIDRNAFRILDQQIRDVMADVELGKRALAVAMVQQETEGRRAAKTEAILADLEARAVAALQDGREDLAREAAAAILAVEADRDTARSTHAGFETEVAAMQAAYRDATRRFAALQRGRAVAQAAEAVRRLRARARHGNVAAASSLANGEATLARLRTRQCREKAVETALGTIESASAEVTASSVAARLGANGFGAAATSSLDDVMNRLAGKARGAGPAAAA